MGRNGTMKLSDFTFRHNDEVLKPMQEDFLKAMARVPKERVLGIEAYAVFHYTNAEIQEEGRGGGKRWGDRLTVMVVA